MALIWYLHFYFGAEIPVIVNKDIEYNECKDKASLAQKIVT